MGGLHPDADGEVSWYLVFDSSYPSHGRLMGDICTRALALYLILSLFLTSNQPKGWNYHKGNVNSLQSTTVLGTW
jgi:hypothetical protein